MIVYLDTSVKQALRWKQLDPHFREAGTKEPTKAPPPAARFPGSPDGWKDALNWADSKRPGGRP